MWPSPRSAGKLTFEGEVTEISFTRIGDMVEYDESTEYTSMIELYFYLSVNTAYNRSTLGLHIPFFVSLLCIYGIQEGKQ